MALPAFALPGQLLGPASKYAPGPGTHIHSSQVYASTAGPVTSTPPSSSKTTTTTTTTTLPTLAIGRLPTTSPLSTTNSGTSILPTITSQILGRITRLGPRFASLEILTIDSLVCRESFQGLIRREDVRATEKDKVKIEESFRVGDLVRGVVISLGDQSNYYVSTAENELGVVMARSREGNVMWPVSWREFRDPVSGAVEGRKVAKPF